ncbi:MAG: ribosome biogenesis GTPase Der [Spirochaetae bacterium HGW-Spirochaetae-1]|jgi:GTP-binding protein|nr:MAG: ribosome biogenesis GTPase Der [Spirochaetae bacterium HGW-Spirochaetae-1]
MSGKLPIVTIVGRRNVGKSTLFNALIKEKKAIVDAHAGLTRDVLYYNVHYNDCSFILSDTPGLDLPDLSELSAPILDNARRHLERSSAIILLLEDPAPDSFDWDLAKLVRKMSIPSIVAVNKMDNNEKMANVANFYELGFKEIIPISALQRYNLPLLLDRVTELLPMKKTAVREPDITISIVGRPNSGKSTLLNAFMGYERSVVSEIPGTTRDSVDDYFTFHEKLVKVVDTAGIRKKSKMTENIEYYSFTRTIDSIKGSDIVIHVMDAEIGLSETDKKIFDEIQNVGKPVIFAVNKWDTIPKDDKTFDAFKDKLIFKFYRADDFPIISISAKNKVRINKILQTAIQLKEKAGKRIDTPTLNKVIARLQSAGRLPQLGHKIRIYYAAQIHTIPPQFKFFVNNAALFRKDVVRYFEKSLQKEFDMEGIPVIIHIEGKKRQKTKK